MTTTAHTSGSGRSGAEPFSLRAYVSPAQLTHGQSAVTMLARARAKAGVKPASDLGQSPLHTIVQTLQTHRARQAAASEAPAEEAQMEGDAETAPRPAQPPALEVLQEVHGTAGGSALYRDGVLRPRAAVKAAVEGIAAAIEAAYLPLLGGHSGDYAVHVELHPLPATFCATVVVRWRAALAEMSAARAALLHELLSVAAAGQTLEGTMRFWREVASGERAVGPLAACAPLGLSQTVEEGSDSEEEAEVRGATAGEQGCAWCQPRGPLRRQSLQGLAAVLCVSMEGVAYVGFTAQRPAALGKRVRAEEEREEDEAVIPPEAPPQPRQQQQQLAAPPTSVLQLDSDRSFTRVLLGLS